MAEAHPATSALPKPRCAICGLRIEPVDAGGPWEHLETIAGREAQRDHEVKYDRGV